MEKLQLQEKELFEFKLLPPDVALPINMSIIIGAEFIHDMRGVYLENRLMSLGYSVKKLHDDKKQSQIMTHNVTKTYTKEKDNAVVELTYEHGIFTTRLVALLNPDAKGTEKIELKKVMTNAQGYDVVKNIFKSYCEVEIGVMKNKGKMLNDYLENLTQQK